MPRKTGREPGRGCRDADASGTRSIMARKSSVASGPNVRCVGLRARASAAGIRRRRRSLRRVMARLAAVRTGQLAVGITLPVGGLEDPFPEPPRRLVLAQPVDDNRQIELGPGGPAFVHPIRPVLQRQRGRRDRLRISELPGVAQRTAQLQHGVEGRRIRFPVELLAGVQQDPGLVDLRTTGVRPCSADAIGRVGGGPTGPPVRPRRR